MALMKDLIAIPERVHQGDFVLKLAEGVSHAEQTMLDYVVTPQFGAVLRQCAGVHQAGGRKADRVAESLALIEKTEALMEARLAEVTKVAPAFSATLRAYRRAVHAEDPCLNVPRRSSRRCERLSRGSTRMVR